MKRSIVVLLTVWMFSVNAYSYGWRGHLLVGAIADRRLKNTPTATKIKALLDGLTLQQAANLPDDIKDWDRCGSNKNIPGPGDPVSASERINAELRAFFQANLCSGHPSHHEFHYTDVPVFGNEKYADGPVGRSEFDIVQMIPFCIRVLKGEIPENNDRAITKSVAVILLAHYLGDIHQPLHVGAQYFDANKNPASKGFEDQGGNKLILYTFWNGELTEAGKFHGYWDSQTVNNAFGNMNNGTVANKLANQVPANWQLAGGVETWAEQMADEIMPLAREAHDRLEFSSINIKAGEREIRSGDAKETKKIGGKFYAIWAADTVKNEIHKGGWRLAAILESVL